MSADRIERSGVGWAERGGRSEPVGPVVTEQDVEAEARETLAAIRAGKLERAIAATRAAARER